MKSTRLRNILTVIMLMIASAAITVNFTASFLTDFYNEKVKNIYKDQTFINKIATVNDLILENYIGIGETDRDHMMDAAIYALLRASGDPYANYFTKAEFSLLNDKTTGQQRGSVGVTSFYDSEGGCLVITEVEPMSPADEAKIVNGDRIMSIDDMPVSGMTFDEAIGHIIGEGGTTLKLTILRGDEASDLIITRRDFTYKSVLYELIGENKNIAHVRIKTFTTETPSEFEAMLQKIIEDENITGCIFDVRNNLGGVLDGVTYVLNRLLPQGVIVTLVDKDGKSEIIESDADFVPLNSVVLVNASSASASELFAGALRDGLEVPIVGVKTFGKGMSQNVFTLSDGSGVTISDTMYYTASGKNFEGEGIIPDYVVDLTEEQKELYYLLTPYSDPQMLRAMAILAENAAFVGEG